ncbi:MAG: hypothetical protein M3421_01080, partial [Bacteroidota bacterium]|nr:hypothetical protein [Bacteroidota bacterium]
METGFIVFISIFLLLTSLAFYFKRNDEFPLIIIFFFLSTGLNRYYAVTEGLANWVDVKYAYSIFYMDDALALSALNLFLLGTSIFVLSYIFFNQPGNKKLRANDSNLVLRTFLFKKRKLIIYLFIGFLIINSYTAILVGEAENIAYGNSYAFLFKLALG